MNVLVVDDEPSVRYALDLILRRDGHSVAAADGGKSALALLASRKFDVVVADIRMPDMSGLELLNTVRAQWPTTPVIIITAHATLDTGMAALKAGAFEFIVKPFDADELLACIRATSATEQPYRAKAGSSNPLDNADTRPAVKPLPDSPLARWDPSQGVLATTLPDLIASFCHDLGNDLFAAERFAIHAKSPSKAKQVIPQLIRAISRVQEAVQAMRAFLRPLRQLSDEPAELLTLSPIEVDRKVRAIIKREVFADNITCTLDASKAGGKKIVPLFLLDLLLVPLLQNAQKVIDQRPGRIEVSISTLSPEELLHLTVSDDGPGWRDQMEELLAYARDPHWPSRNDHSSREGLRNVYRLAHALGGDLKLDHSQWGGARVEVFVSLR